MNEFNLVISLYVLYTTYTLCTSNRFVEPLHRVYSERVKRQNYTYTKRIFCVRYVHKLDLLYSHLVFEARTVYMEHIMYILYIRYT